MDLLTHIASGIAAATVVTTWSGNFLGGKSWKIWLFGALGGAFPDVDAISMWSRFDSTFGQLFGLSHSGRVIYGEKFWYSHHAFFHSLAAVILITLFLFLLNYIFHRLQNKMDLSVTKYVRGNSLLIIAFMSGYLLHLAGDLSTPASVWGGINLFWPGTMYIGGSGKIWWWNNYDIFLLLILCIFANSLIFLSFKPKIKRMLTLCIAFVTFILVIVQINTRQYDYAYKGNTTHYTEMEQHSKEEQERILGISIYRCLEWIDKHLPLHF